MLLAESRKESLIHIDFSLFWKECQKSLCVKQRQEEHGRLSQMLLMVAWNRVRATAAAATTTSSVHKARSVDTYIFLAVINNDGGAYSELPLPTNVFIFDYIYVYTDRVRSIEASKEKERLKMVLACHLSRHSQSQSLMLYISLCNGWIMCFHSMLIHARMLVYSSYINIIIMILMLSLSYLILHSYSSLSRLVCLYIKALTSHIYKNTEYKIYI